MHEKSSMESIVGMCNFITLKSTIKTHSPVVAPWLQDARVMPSGLSSQKFKGRIDQNIEVADRDVKKGNYNYRWY